jgi:hypothetical protein
VVNIELDGIKDIYVNKFSTETHIDFEMKAMDKTNTTRLNLSTSDAKYLYEKLKEKFESEDGKK